MHTNSAEDISNNQKVKNDRGSRKIFSRLSCFHRLYIEQQIPRPIDNKRKKIFYSGKNALLHDSYNLLFYYLFCLNRYHFVIQ